MGVLAEWGVDHTIFLVGAIVLVLLPFVLGNLGRRVGEVRVPLEGAAFGWTVGFHVRRHEGSTPETAVVEIQARIRMGSDHNVFLTPEEARQVAALLRTAARTKVDG